MKEYLQSFNLLTEEEIQQLQQLGTPRIFKKGEFLIKEGQVCQHVAFVESGFFRSYYHNSDGEDITFCFTFANSFVTAYSSFINQNRTQENIEALSEVKALMLSRESILQLEAQNPNWLKLTKAIAEQEYIKLEFRVMSLLRERAETRYKELLLKHPEYLQLIPLNYLASYLGVTQRHLSRIRKTAF
jgi:CRP-like cAMP-binding protein